MYIIVIHISVLSVFVSVSLSWLAVMRGYHCQAEHCWILAFRRRRVKPVRTDLSEADSSNLRRLTKIYYWGGLDSAESVNDNLGVWVLTDKTFGRQAMQKKTPQKHLSECFLHIVFSARRQQEWSSFVNTEGPISYSPPPPPPFFLMQLPYSLHWTGTDYSAAEIVTQWHDYSYLPITASMIKKERGVIKYCTRLHLAWYYAEVVFAWIVFGVSHRRFENDRINVFFDARRTLYTSQSRSHSDDFRRFHNNSSFGECSRPWRLLRKNVHGTIALISCIAALWWHFYIFILCALSHLLLADARLISWAALELKINFESFDVPQLTGLRVATGCGTFWVSHAFRLFLTACNRFNCCFDFKFIGRIWWFGSYWRKFTELYTLSAVFVKLVRCPVSSRGNLDIYTCSHRFKCD